jgi:hypothetical protein
MAQQLLQMARQSRLSIRLWTRAEGNARLDAIKRAVTLPRCCGKPVTSSSIASRGPRRLGRVPRETFDFLHDERSIWPIDLQQALGLAVLHDLSPFQQHDAIEISQR